MEEIGRSIFSDWLYNMFINMGLTDSWASYLELLVYLIFISVFLVFATQFIRWLISTFIVKATRLKRASFLIHLQRNKFPRYIALFVPYIAIKAFIPYVFSHFPAWITPLNKLTDIWVVYLFIRVIMSVIRSAFDMIAETPSFKDKPIKSYLQVITIVLIIFGVVICYSILTGKSPGVFFATIAAGSAIFMLIFQDMIKGFVASVLVTSNDMIRLGDWITMPKYNADGDVTEINLTTVKVQNFDKTVSTIPTYAVISDSFQNWRGMQAAGGRRIKRSILIKQNSIRYIREEEIERFSKIQGISDYIVERQKEINEHNEKIRADRTLAVNGRNLTNLGLFRQYIEWYLRTHPDTHKGYTMMVRQLAPTATGLPLELYVFTNTTKWVAYENIMSDIFDHLIASVGYFDLQIFELEAGNDTRMISIEKQTPISN